MAALERCHEYTGYRDPVSYELERRCRFVLPHAEMFPLGTLYFEIVRRIRNLLQSARR
jgi:hypothetical protein